MRGRLARRTDQNSPTPLCATAVKQRGDGHEARDDLRSVDEQHPHFRDSSATVLARAFDLCPALPTLYLSF
jgi:hypothetical protein